LTTPDPDYSPTTPGQSTPTPTDQCDGSFGPKPNLENCHEYYKCLVGKNGWVVKMMSCGNLAFNPEINECDWPYNVPLCAEGTTQDHVTGTIRPDDHCTLGDPLVPDPDDCHSYLECEPTTSGSTKYVSVHCGTGLAFNPVIQSCDWSSNVPGCD